MDGCMYACIYLPNYLSIHLSIYLSTYLCMYVCMYVYTYIYICEPEKGGRKPAAARRVSLFLAGVAAQDTWSAACEAAVPRMRGAYVMVIEGAEKQAGRLWDKFGMKDVVRNAIRCMLA